MSYAHSSSIQSVSNVIDTAPSGYAPKSASTRMTQDSQSQALTLNVLSARNNLVVLQEQTTGKRINLDKQSIVGANTAFLAKGDKLILIDHTDKTASFRVEQAKANNKQVNLHSFSQSLSGHWPDIQASVFTKSPPVVLNQLQLMNNSVQAKLLTNAIVEISQKTGQPVLSLSIDAKVSFTGANDTLNVSASTANSMRLTINLGNSKTFIINIPLLPELARKLNNGSNVKLDMNADNVKSPIGNIGIISNGNISDNISASTVRNINDALTAKASQLTPLLNTLMAMPHSKALKNGIVITPTAQNLTILGNSISRPLLQSGITIPQASLHEARILVTQGINNNPHIHLSLLSKPVVLSINNNELGTINRQLFQAEHNKGSSPSFASPVIIESEYTANSNVSNISAHNAVGTTSSHTSSIKDKLINLLVAQGKSAQSVQNTMASLQTVISNEMHQSLPHAESLQTSLPSLLTQLQSMQKLADGDTNIWLVKAIASIERLVAKPSAVNSSVSVDAVAGSSVATQDLGDIEVPDLAELKRDFTAALLPNISTPAIAPISVNGSSSSLVNGLVAMLQASLQAKLLAQQPNLLNSLLNNTSHPTQMAAFAGMGGAKSPAASSTNKANHAKILQDLHKLDPKGNLITELNKALSKHSLQKLSAADSSLQGQDSFYYTLPNLFSPQHQDIELVIRREQQQAKANEDANTQQAWQLNMKLDIGDSGEVLAKVKLVGNQLDLNLYASKQKLKEKILDYLPFLNRRLVALGLDVKQQCYLGKIPHTLHKTEFQMVQEYV